MNRIIELKWTCADCGTKDILGRHKQCPNCGSPREKGEMQMDGLSSSDYGSDGMNRAETVTDPELLELANAGYDWFCTHCSSGNRGDGDRCKACGAPRYGTNEEEQDCFPVEPSSSDVGMWKDEEGQFDFAVALSESIKETSNYNPTGTVHRKAYNWGQIGFISLICIAIVAMIVGLWWAFSTKEVPGRVIAMNWTHTTHLDRWVQTTVGAWEDDTFQRQEVKPVNGSGERAGMIKIAGSCHERHHHYQQYQCGTKQESYDCSYNESYSGTCTRSESYACGETCSSNRNGFATCRTRYCSRNVSYSCTKSRRIPKTCQRTVPKYCQRSIEETWCNYRTQKWQRDVQTAVATGYGKDGMHFKELNPGALDRIRHSSHYTVGIGYEWNERKLMHEETLSKSEYLTWDDNEPVTLMVRNVGSIADIVRYTKQAEKQDD